MKTIANIDDLNAAVDNLAPKIINPVNGSFITISDSLDRPLRSLTLYGKSTQEGTPTPDAPSPIVCAGEGGSITSVVCGKNFIKDEDALNYPSATAENTSVLKLRKFTLFKGMTYTISFDTENTGKAVYLASTSGWDRAEFTMDGKRHSFTKTFDKTVSNYTSGGVRAVVVLETSDVLAGAITNVLIEASDRATEYEPYTGQTLAAATPNGLWGILVTSGGNYTDENNQSWVADEIDFKRGVYVQRIKKLVFNGGEGWNGSSALTGRYSIGTYGKNTFGLLNASRLLCSHFKNGGNSYTTAVNVVFNNKGQLCFNTAFETVDEWETFLSEQNTAGNPVTVIFPLETPVETPLTAEEIAAFKELHTNYPTTTIYNDAGAGQAIEYAADTKIYIDNKFEELHNAILSMGGNV